MTHGVGANRSYHSTLCKELASMGLIVIAPDHKDTTALCWWNEEGKEYKYYSEMDM